MSEIRILDGVFKDSEIKGKEYLLYLDIDRLLAPCYEAIGLKPKKERYGGWEEKDISGHSLGHYLSALSHMYVATEDIVIKEKLNYAIDEIGYLQDVEKSGYVSGFKKDCFIKVFSKDFNVTRFELGDSWVPWYSIHKIYAGLLDAYKLTNNKKTLNILIKLSNWAKEGLDNLTEEEFDKMLYCEHGGMCEVFGELYEITKDKKYLDLAVRFIDKEIIYPLFEGRDDLEGKHANTQIPKILGIAKLYDITKEEKYRKASELFWNIVTKERSYVIGGNSIDEHFGKVGSEALGVTTAETCNTYNMLKLTEYLYKWNHDVKYMDYYEKALYNHILASQDPISGMKTYFVSTKPGHFKVYCSPDKSFWCCTGTGMENPAKYTRNIYYVEEDTLYINLFISSSIKIEDRNIKISQITDFPREEKTKIVIEETNNATYSIKVRIPYWLNNNIKVSLNNNVIEFKQDKGYVSITKLWKKGDTLDISLDMNMHTYISREDKNKVCFMYGPLVLAGALGRENFPETDILEDHLKLNHYKGINVPIIISEDNNLLNNIKKKKDKILEFELDCNNEYTKNKVKLIPFYNIHHERYTIYFTKMTKEEYESKDYLSYEELLENITIDKINFNEQQMEIEHKLNFKNSISEYSLEYGRGYREARDKGYFSFILDKGKEEDVYLCLSNLEIEEDRAFTLYVEDEMLIKEDLKSEGQPILSNSFYSIPREIIKNKEKIEVKIESEEKLSTGKIFSIRLTSKKI